MSLINKRQLIDIVSRLFLLPQYQITSSKSYKYTWFRIAKNGTSTLWPLLTEKTCPDLDSKDYPYIKYSYSDHFKFCFIRNPWDRVVSCYKQKVIGKNMFEECWDKDFEYFVNYIGSKGGKRSDQHIRQQVYLFPINDVDFIGRFENFKDDASYALNDILKLDISLPHKNRTSKGSHYSNFYTNKTRKLVLDIYRDDIEFGNYKFGE